MGQLKNSIVSSVQVALECLRSNLVLSAYWIFPDVRVVANSDFVVRESFFAVPVVFSVVNDDVSDELNLTHVSYPPWVALPSCDGVEIFLIAS